MKKSQEVLQPDSCFNRAEKDELIFVLLGRDFFAPTAIRAWVEARVNSLKNMPTDKEIVEALECAKAMERAQAEKFRIEKDTFQVVIFKNLTPEKYTALLLGHRCSIPPAQVLWYSKLKDYQFGDTQLNLQELDPEQILPKEY
jgi:hypothetical protein